MARIRAARRANIVEPDLFWNVARLFGNGLIPVTEEFVDLTQYFEPGYEVVVYRSRNSHLRARELIDCFMGISTK